MGHHLSVCSSSTSSLSPQAMCGYDQVDEGMGENMLVDGMFGLGRGSVDLVSQLKQQKIITQNVIGHCFNSKGGGFRIIGKDVPSSSHISWVPMSKNSKYYSPGRATLHLDMKSIVTKPMEVVLDSGSTYTHFPEDLHDQLVAALKASLSKSSVEEVHDPALPLCWKGPRPFKSVDDLKKELKPLLSLNFGGGVTMKIPPENYLIITRHGNACFAILAKKEIDLYIIGDITMQDQLVIYDNENERISWQQYPCGKKTKSKSAIVSRI
ncbi:unnamed protein product [Urochloa decumbens]|uniref:Peptidase A1 domain-containing protein n=1 Tax=Urochloa decumbens TaxID=240449 RepID=A0ABC9HA87_9POAL